MLRGRRQPDRKEAIVADTFDLIMQHGLSGTTTARIAAKGSITEAALYRHFKNRREILITVFDQVSNRFFNLLVSSEEDVLDYLRTISRNLYYNTLLHPEDAKVIFEFMCSSPSENLRKMFQDKLRDLLALIQAMLIKGIEQGILRSNLDVNLSSWEIFSLGLTISLVALIDNNNELSEQRALKAMEDLITRMVVSGQGLPDFQAEKKITAKFIRKEKKDAIPVHPKNTSKILIDKTKAYE